MKSPYTALVYFNQPARQGEADMEFTWEEDRADMEAGMSIAYHFWQTGHGAGVQGTLRAATMFIGAGLNDGEEAWIVVKDREGKDTGYSSHAERDDRGRLLTTLGSRWGKPRLFMGV